MKNNVKKSIMALLVMGALGATATATSGVFATKAEVNPYSIQGVDVSTYQMEIGAGIRVNGDGLRFSADMDTATYEALEAKGASYGMLIVPKSYLTAGYELTEENVFEQNKFYFEEENPTPEDNRRAMLNLETETLGNYDKDANVEIYGVIADIGAMNILREFVGVAYVKVPVVNASTGEPTGEYEYKFARYYGDDMANNTRSMYYVAQLALESDWAGDKTAVEENYITTYKTEVTDVYGYTYGYTEKHVLTKLDGTQETLKEEVKYGDLNTEVTAEFYNDNALYSAYYYDGKEMPKSNLYANGRTTIEVNYKEANVDFENMVWSKAFTTSNYKDMLYVTEWGDATTETPYSITTEIPEGGVEGTYLYYSGSADKARKDIQLQLNPAYGKGYYQSILNTGLPFVVKYDVYVENVNADYSTTSIKLKGWNGTASFNSDVGSSVTVGVWKTVSFDLSYLVNNWGNYRIFGLELESYANAGQKVNFYLGNIRIEEKPKVWRTISSTSDMRAYSGGAGTSSTNKAAGSATFTVVTSATSEADATVLGDRTGNYYKYTQGQGWETMSWRIKPTYSMEYYQLLLNSDKSFKVCFDVYFKGDGSVAPYKWVNGTLTKQASQAGEAWYEYSCTLKELMNDWTATTAGQTYGPRLFAITGMQTDQSPKTYVWIGNIRLVEVTE